MKRLLIQKIRDAAEFRAAGYFDDVVACGKIVGDILELEDAEYERLRVKYRKAQEFSAWPAWANAIAKLRKDEDRGVGDTVHRLIGEANSERVKRWHLKLFKATCGCQRRHAEWNALYPYAEEATSRHSGRLGDM